MMEPISRHNMSWNTNTTVVTAANVTTSAGVELLSLPSLSSYSATTSNTKTSSLCQNDSLIVLQHCINTSNVIQHHQYPPFLVEPPPLVSSPFIYSAQTSSLLSTTTIITPGSIPQFQQHGESHKMVTDYSVPKSAAIMSPSNITTGMASRPFGTLPHEQVIPNHIHHYHQHKQSSSTQSYKIVMDSGSINSAQIFNTPVINPHHFQPTHVSNKIEQFDSIQQQPNEVNILYKISDTNLPILSSTCSPQSYEERYHPRTTSHQVGNLSLITCTAVTTINVTAMNNIVSNSNGYQTQPVPLQKKTSNNYDYYHFDNTVSASQISPGQIDNISLMKTPVQHCDPMHIVKNFQSMQSDIDCYSINNKTFGPTPLLNHMSKSTIQHHHLQQLPKSSVIDSSYSHNNQYFNMRQPPPAHLPQYNQPHLQQHIIAGNPKILPPTSLTDVSPNVYTYLDVQHQHHQRWNLDQHKSPTVSTSPCFSTNSFDQPLPQQQHQTYHNTVSMFNVQSSTSSIHPKQQVSQSTHYNFNVTSENQTYYSFTTTLVSSNVTSVTTTSPPISLYNQQHHNNHPKQNPYNNNNNLTKNVHREDYAVNDNNNSLVGPRVIVPDIEEELSHFCDDFMYTSYVQEKPLKVTTQKPSFSDSYIEFLHQRTNKMDGKKEDKCLDEKNFIRPLTPKPKSKPYIPLVPLPKPKVVVASEKTSCNINSEDKITSNFFSTTSTTSTTDEDPRYFPLPKTSLFITGISDDGSDGSHDENSWLSADDEQNNWWISSPKGSGSVSSSVTSVIKNKVDGENKITKSTKTKKKPTNSDTEIKKQQTQYQQPGQLSHRLAKEKTKLLGYVNGELEMDDDEDLISNTDSDIDPAWKTNDDNNDTSKNSISNSNPHNFIHKKYSKKLCFNSKHQPSTSSSIDINNTQTDNSTTTMPFKSGSFVVLKSDFRGNGQTIPQQLWRVEGTFLLQKFQRCDEENVYKSTLTYTGLNPLHHNIYCQVAVEFITSYTGMNNKSSNTEILVQLLRKKGDRKMCSK